MDVPFDVEKAFGSKRPKVKATIGGIPYRGTLVRMGSECHLLPILKENREELGKTYGDEVDDTVGPDTELRVIEVPAELEKAFETEKGAKAFFETLAYTHRREYVKWIDEAKKTETRRNRIAKTVELLKAGKKTRSRQPPNAVQKRNSLCFCYV